MGVWREFPRYDKRMQTNRGNVLPEESAQHRGEAGRVSGRWRPGRRGEALLPREPQHNRMENVE